MVLSYIKQKAYFLNYFLALYPWKSTFIFLALIVSGFAEALSFAALIPLLSIAFKNNSRLSDENSFEEYIYNLFNNFNIELNLSSILIIITLLVIFKSFLSFYSMKEIGYICADIEKDFRKKISFNLLDAKWSFLQNNKTGNFSSAISLQVQQAANFIRAFGLFLAAFIQVLFYSLVAFKISMTVTFFGFLIGILIALFLSKYVSLAKKSSEIISEKQGVLLSRLIDSLRGVKSNKAMGLEERLKNYLSTDINVLAQMKKKIVFSSAVLKNSQEPALAIIISISLFFLLSSWTNSIESLIVLILVFYRMGMRIGHLQVYYQQLVTAIPHLRFVLEIINNASDKRENLDLGKSISYIRNIEFRNVHFSYDKLKILDNISFRINSGEFVAIVGASGSGKTTLIDMLLGFNEPDSGNININDKDIKNISKKSLRKTIGYLPQETILFKDSVKNNLTFGDTNINNEIIFNSLKISNSVDFIERFTNGLEFDVGEHGSKLSGGQKQRLGITRALLNNPSLLILDEPTSALDKQSEKEILNSIKELKGKMMIIAISHQDTFIQAADRKLVMTNGSLIEQQNQKNNI
jgi:ATP-binding cassette subfamily C protein